MPERKYMKLNLKKCNCNHSKVKVIPDGPCPIVVCLNCGKRTNRANDIDHTVFCWNHGFVFSP